MVSSSNTEPRVLFGVAESKENVCAWWRSALGRRRREGLRWRIEVRPSLGFFLRCILNNSVLNVRKTRRKWWFLFRDNYVLDLCIEKNHFRQRRGGASQSNGRDAQEESGGGKISWKLEDPVIWVNLKNMPLQLILFENTIHSLQIENDCVSRIPWTRLCEEPFDHFQFTIYDFSTFCQLKGFSYSNLKINEFHFFDKMSCVSCNSMLLTCSRETNQIGTKIFSGTPSSRGATSARGAKTRWRGGEEKGGGWEEEGDGESGQGWWLIP